MKHGASQLYPARTMEIIEFMLADEVQRVGVEDAIELVGEYLNGEGVGSFNGDCSSLHLVSHQKPRDVYCGDTFHKILPE